MVRHIHITVDDETYDRPKAVKDEHGGMWEELVCDRLETRPAED